MAVLSTITGSEQQYRKVQLIYYAMFFSLLVYLALGLWLPSIPIRSGEMKQAATFARIIYFLCAVLIALIFMARKKIRHRSIFTFRSPREVSNQTSFHATGHLLIYVLCEVIGLFGFVILFLIGSLQHFLNLMLVSIILMIILYPRRVTGSDL